MKPPKRGRTQNWRILAIIVCAVTVIVLNAIGIPEAVPTKLTRPHLLIVLSLNLAFLAVTLNRLSRSIALWAIRSTAPRSADLFGHALPAILLFGYLAFATFGTNEIFSGLGIYASLAAGAGR